MSSDLSLKPKNVLNIHVQSALPNIVLFCYMYINDLFVLFFKITHNWWNTTYLPVDGFKELVSFDVFYTILTKT